MGRGWRPGVDFQGLNVRLIRDSRDELWEAPGYDVAAAARTLEAAGLQIDIGGEPYLAPGRGWHASYPWNDEFPFRWTWDRRADVMIPLTEARDCHLLWRALAHDWGAPWRP